MHWLTKFLREPLLHFTVIGLILFGAYAVTNEPTEQQPKRIVVGPERVAQLEQSFKSMWRVPPTEEQTQALIAGFVREEVYYREALELGLDRDDAVIRQRLRQKMEFLTDAGGALLDPDPEELQAYYESNKAVYQRPARVAFDQLFLGHDADAEGVKTTLLALQTNPAENWALLGERTLLPPSMRLSSADAVERVFGRDFFSQIENASLGTWAGPVLSTFGVHLVRVTDKTEATSPPLSEVEAEVLRDWTQAKSNEARESFYQALLERYTVEIAESLPAGTDQ